MNRLDKYEPNPEFRITVDVNDFSRKAVERSTGAADEIVVEKTLPTGEVIGYAMNIAKGSEITAGHALLASFALTKRWRDMRQAAATK